MTCPIPASSSTASSSTAVPSSPTPFHGRPLAFTTTTTSSDTQCAYTLREFDVTKDLPALTAICRRVYGGSDYLPQTAPLLASDPNSSFWALTDSETDRIAAVGNARKFQPNAQWLEAIRTCQHHRSRGLARRLTHSLIEQAKREGCEMYSCTVESNAAMRKVFEKVGMKCLGEIHQCSFAVLKALPGWGSAPAEGDDDDGTEAQPLLQALGVQVDGANAAMEHLNANNMESSRVTSRDELDEMLTIIRNRGGIGHVVGLYELLPDDVVAECLTAGRVWKLSVRRNDGDNDDIGGGGGGGGDHENDFALIAFSQDEKISSLRSPWVCSISATSTAALESALIYACSDDHGLLKTLDGKVAFTVAFDVCGLSIKDVDSKVIRALPLTDDACLLFGSEPIS